MAEAHHKRSRSSQSAAPAQLWSLLSRSLGGPETKGGAFGSPKEEKASSWIGLGLEEAFLDEGTPEFWSLGDLQREPDPEDLSSGEVGDPGAALAPFGSLLNVNFDDPDASLPGTQQSNGRALPGLFGYFLDPAPADRSEETDNLGWEERHPVIAMDLMDVFRDPLADFEEDEALRPPSAGPVQGRGSVAASTTAAASSLLEEPELEPEVRSASRSSSSSGSSPASTSDDERNQEREVDGSEASRANLRSPLDREGFAFQRQRRESIQLEERLKASKPFHQRLQMSSRHVSAVQRGEPESIASVTAAHSAGPHPSEARLRSLWSATFCSLEERMFWEEPARYCLLAGACGTYRGGGGQMWVRDATLALHGVCTSFFEADSKTNEVHPRQLDGRCSGWASLSESWATTSSQLLLLRGLSRAKLPGTWTGTEGSVEGLALQAFRAAVGSLVGTLDGEFSAAVAEFSDYPTPLAFWSRLRPWSRRVEEVWRACQVEPQGATVPSSASLLVRLFCSCRNLQVSTFQWLLAPPSEPRTGDEKSHGSSPSHLLLEHALKPYLQCVEQWVTQGKLQDPFSEFTERWTGSIVVLPFLHNMEQIVRKGGALVKKLLSGDALATSSKLRAGISVKKESGPDEEALAKYFTGEASQAARLPDLFQLRTSLRGETRNSEAVIATAIPQPVSIADGLGDTGSSEPRHSPLEAQKDQQFQQHKQLLPLVAKSSFGRDLAALTREHLDKQNRQRAFRRGLDEQVAQQRQQKEAERARRLEEKPSLGLLEAPAASPEAIEAASRALLEEHLRETRAKEVQAQLLQWRLARLRLSGAREELLAWERHQWAAEEEYRYYHMTNRFEQMTWGPVVNPFADLRTPVSSARSANLHDTWSQNSWPQDRYWAEDFASQRSWSGTGVQATAGHLPMPMAPIDEQENRWHRHPIVTHLPTQEELDLHQLSRELGPHPSQSAEHPSSTRSKACTMEVVVASAAVRREAYRRAALVLREALPAAGQLPRTQGKGKVLAVASAKAAEVAASLHQALQAKRREEEEKEEKEAKADEEDWLMLIDRPRHAQVSCEVDGEWAQESGAVALEVAMERCLLNPIQRRVTAMDRLLTRHLLRDLNLLPKMRQMTRYWLMSESRLLEPFVLEVLDRYAEPGAADAGVTLPILQGSVNALFDAVVPHPETNEEDAFFQTWSIYFESPKTASGNGHQPVSTQSYPYPSNSQSYSLSSSAVPSFLGAGALKFLDALRIKVEVNSPLSEVFSESCLLQYSRLFQLLSAVQFALHGSKQSWRQLMESVDRRGKTGARIPTAVAALRHHVFLFLTTLQRYLLVDVIATEFYHMESRLADMQSLDDLLGAHRQFLEACESKAFLGLGGEAALGTILALLQQALRIQRVFSAQAAQAEKLKAEGRPFRFSAVRVSELQGLEVTFEDLRWKLAASMAANNARDQASSKMATTTATATTATAGHRPDVAFTAIVGGADELEEWLSTWSQRCSL